MSEEPMGGPFRPIENLRQLEQETMCDCLHVDDVAALLKEKGLDKRPEGK